MATCETCGNNYDKAFQISMNGTTHTFDSFECAIHALAPTCAHCGTRIVGHGLEKGDAIYCCAHCAGQKGEHGLKDAVKPTFRNRSPSVTRVGRSSTPTAPSKARRPAR